MLVEHCKRLIEGISQRKWIVFFFKKTKKKTLKLTELCLKNPKQTCTL